MTTHLRNSLPLYAWLCIWLLGMADIIQPACATDVEDVLQQYFPQATHVGEFAGEPLAAPVYRDEELLGYLMRTSDIAPIPAYSGEPITLLVGLDVEGRITGLEITEHSEPILVVGISEQDLAHYVEQYRGVTVEQKVKLGGAERDGYVTIDGITGATITAMVMNATVMKSVQQVAATRGIPLQTDVSEAEAGTGESGSQETRQAELASAQPPPAWWLGESSEPFWVSVWRDRVWQIAVLMVALTVLTIILLFQDWLTRRPGLLRVVRTAFLLFTLFFIGWYTLAQLSIIHVLTFINAILHHFSWESFLVDPLIFILWGFVALTLLLWGRGVYCGWLCPFGALQELLHQLAQRLKIPEYKFPDVVHERLTAIKYIIFVALFGLSLQSIGYAARAAEVEPFKTAIVMHFDRGGIFLLYALGLLAIAVFNRKFYLQVPVSAGCGTGDPGAAAHLRLVAAAQGMRPALPDLCPAVRGAGDPPDR